MWHDGRGRHSTECSLVSHGEYAEGTDRLTDRRKDASCNVISRYLAALWLCVCFSIGYIFLVYISVYCVFFFISTVRYSVNKNYYKKLYRERQIPAVPTRAASLSSLYLEYITVSRATACVAGRQRRFVDRPRRYNV